MKAKSTRRKPPSRRREKNNHRPRQQPAIRLITYEPGGKSLDPRETAPTTKESGNKRYANNEIPRSGYNPYDSSSTDHPTARPRTTTTSTASQYRPTPPAAVRDWGETDALAAFEQLPRSLPRPQLSDTPRPHFRPVLRRIILRNSKPPSGRHVRQSN